MTTLTTTEVQLDRGRYAGATVVLALALNYLDCFVDLANGDFTPDSSDSQGWPEWLVVAGVVVFATTIVYAVVLRRPTATKSLVLGVLAVVALPVFWTELMAVLGIGAAAAALAVGTSSLKAKVGLALGTLGLLGNVVIALTS